MADPHAPLLALVLTGGGARAAYQVGFLRFLARVCPDLDIPILTGVSAGAINAAHLASHRGNLAEAVRDLEAIWRQISPAAVFRSDSWTLSRNLLGWMESFLTGGKRAKAAHRGFMDTSPLEAFLTSHLDNRNGVLLGVQEKIDDGRLKALGITTTDYGTGQAVTWVQGRQIDAWRRPHRRSRETELTTQHVLASAALPLLFPAVSLEGSWHGDGGLRLTAPLSPAMHLGAERILAVSNRYRRSQSEADESVIHGYPPAAQIIGTMMNAMFLDMLDFDAANMERFNGLIAQLPSSERDGLKPVQTMVLRPSADLGRLSAQFEKQLPRSLRFFTRGFGTRETDAPDSLSLLMFQPDYIEHLMQLGERDAKAQADTLSSFLKGQ